MEVALPYNVNAKGVADKIVGFCGRMQVHVNDVLRSITDGNNGTIGHRILGSLLNVLFLDAYSIRTIVLQFATYYYYGKRKYSMLDMFKANMRCFVLLVSSKILFSFIIRMLPPATKSLILSWCVTHHDYSVLRQGFLQRPIPVAPLNSDNHHATVAQIRASADNFTNQFASGFGYTIFSPSRSAKDMWNGVSGNRFVYDEKDLRLHYHNDHLGEGDVVKLIDVDQYIDSEFLTFLRRGTCVLMFTYYPSDLYITTDDYTMSFDNCGKMSMSFPGSLPYSHFIWDWRRDYVTFHDVLGFVHCYVEVKPCGLNRALVCLIPATRGGIIGNIVRSLLVGTQPLTRFNPNLPCGVQVLHLGSSVVLRDIDTFVQFKMDNEKFSNALALCSTSKTLQMASVQRICDTTQLMYACIPILKKLVGTNLSTLVPNYELTDRAPRAYKREYKDVFDDDPKLKGQFYMPPLIDGALVPASCLSNDIDCYVGRVRNLRKPADFSVAPKYYRYIKEFCVKFSAFAPGKLHPLDIDDVIEDANPSQKNKYTLSLQTRGGQNKAFQKVEAYSEIKDSRNISAVNPGNVVRLSRYTKVLSQYMKDYVPWYAFGLTPEEVANRVVLVASDPFGVLGEGDFSRFDGTQSAIVVDLNTNIMLSVFHPAYHDEIRALRYELSYCLFTTEYGILYNTADSMKSGTANTSGDNTVTDGYNIYSTHRNSGLSIDESWDKIGICGGDDSLTRVLSALVYEKTATDLGFALKCKIRVPGDYVTFLGRVWFDAWSSNLSFFDPLRCLSKLHFSDNSDRRMDVNLLAWRKSVSYYVTDNGNFVGHLAEHMLNITQAGKTEVVERRPWLSAVLLENTHYTTEQILYKFRGCSVFPTYQSNPRTLCILGDPEPAVIYLAELLEIPCIDIITWYEEVRRCDMLNFPCLHRIPSVTDKPTTVDGELVGGPLKPAPVQLSKLEGKEPIDDVIQPACRFFFSKEGCKRGDKCKFSHSKKLCRDFLRGACDRTNCKFDHVSSSAKV